MDIVTIILVIGGVLAGLLLLGGLIWAAIAFVVSRQLKEFVQEGPKPRYPATAAQSKAPLEVA